MPSDVILEITPHQVTPGGGQRGSRPCDGHASGTAQDVEPDKLVTAVRCRASGQTMRVRGGYESAFKLPPSWEGPVGTAKVANRTREIRPCGMTRGACGNVDHGGTRNPPRVSKERVLETLRLQLCAPQIYPDRHRRGKKSEESAEGRVYNTSIVQCRVGESAGVSGRPIMRARVFWHG